MTRNQRILLVVLAVQILLIVVVRMPMGERGVSAGPTPLIAGWDELVPTRVMFGGDDDAVQLLRAGDGWQVEALDGFPADGAKLESLLTKIGALEVRRPLVRSARYHESFGVREQDAEARLRIWGDGNDDPAVDLLFGNPPNFGSIHLRQADEDAVYEVRDLAAYDVSGPAGNWIDKDWLKIDSSDIDGLTVRNVSGSFTVVRGDEGWAVEEPAEFAGQPLGDDQLAGLLSDISGLRISDVAGRRDETLHGFATVGVQVDVRRRDSTDHRFTLLEIGLAVGDGNDRRFVGRDGEGFAGIALESSLQSILDLDLRAMMGASPPS
ncbi:MAG: DUF4340 domain-containing protein [Acidobacteriota bacterium]|nr:DUF4340 domain-containing protein [Acidobacteriota bacterium]